jgi:hypothetical protein
MSNDFIPFAVGGSANVTPQATYAANTSLTQNGFLAGIAKSTDLNKVWRQSSIMSSVLAQFIVNSTGQPAIDDGTTATLLANLTAAISAQSEALVGAARNLTMSVTTASASATLTADEIVVGSALGGLKYTLAGFSKTINLATTGAGGMDTGTAPVSGYVALYAIFNPTTQTAALLAKAEGASAATSIYNGANMPSGYTASALVSVWPTNASSQFIVASQYDRKINFASTSVLNASGVVGTPTSFPLSAAVPKSAKFASGGLSLTQSAAGVATFTIFDQTQSGASSTFVSNNNQAGGGGASNQFAPFPILTPQTWWWVSSSSGPSLSNLNVSLTQYEI